MPAQRPPPGPGHRGERGVGEQLAQHHAGTGLHDVEDAGHDGPPDGLRSTAVTSTNARAADLGERGRAATRSVDVRAGEAEQPRQRAADDAERGQPHRRDRPGQPLGQADAEVHAQARRRATAAPG